MCCLLNKNRIITRQAPTQPAPQHADSATTDEHMHAIKQYAALLMHDSQDLRCDTGMLTGCCGAWPY